MLPAPSRPSWVNWRSLEDRGFLISECGGHAWDEKEPNHGFDGRQGDAPGWGVLTVWGMGSIPAGSSVQLPFFGRVSSRLQTHGGRGRGGGEKGTWLPSTQRPACTSSRHTGSNPCSFDALIFWFFTKADCAPSSCSCSGPQGGCGKGRGDAGSCGKRL